MAITYSKPYGDFQKKRYDLICWLEEEEGKPKLTVYQDKKQENGSGFATIGVGFKVFGNERDLLIAMGLDENLVSAVHDAVKNAAGTEGRFFATNKEAQDDINAKIQKASGNQKLVFEFKNDTQVRNAFDVIVKKEDSKVTSTFPSNVPEDNRERLALLSLAYNGMLAKQYVGGPWVSPSLRQAIIDGDRAEAWYQIRYGSNKPDWAGIAKRRYFESSLFGLYADYTKPTEDETKQAYRTLTLHRKEIYDYEKKHGYWIDESGQEAGNVKSKGVLGFDLAGGTDYSGIQSYLPLTHPEKIDEALNPARDSLIKLLNEGTDYKDFNLSLTAGNYKATEIYLDPGRKNAVDNGNAVPVALNFSNPTLNATKKADRETESTAKNILIGEGGNDTLTGGKGDDILLGGEGNDLYMFKNGDGIDRIADKDGGYLVRDGIDFDKGGRDGTDQWITPDRQVTYNKEGTTLKITFKDGSDTIYINNFDFDKAQKRDRSRLEAYETFGIELEAPPKGALTVGANRQDNAALKFGVPLAARTTLKEGQPRIFTFDSVKANKTPWKVSLNLTGQDPSQIAVSTGTDQYSFINDTVVLTLEAGQTSITFSLLNNTDTSIDDTLVLTATLIDPSGNDAPVKSNEVTIDYTSTQNNLATPTVTITDNNEGKRITDQGIDSLVTAPSYPGTALTKIQGGSGNDLIIGSNSGDQLMGDDGNDWIRGGTVNSNTGEQRLSGGNGNDWINSNGAGGQINGDDGNDILGQAPIKIMASPQDSRTGGEPQWDNADIYWQATSQGITPVATAATLTQQGYTVNVGGGSWRTRADGSRYLQPDLTINSSSGSFTAGDGTQYNYIYQANTPTDGILRLSFNGWLTTKTIIIYADIDAANADTSAVRLDGGAGNDLMQGGDGNDSAYGDGSPYNNLNQTNAGNDQMALGKGDDYADGGDGDDFIIGEDGMSGNIARFEFADGTVQAANQEQWKRAA